jgi:hypothetical protein
MPILLENCNNYDEEANTYQKATSQIKRVRRRHSSSLLRPSAMGGKAHHWPRQTRQGRRRQHGGDVGTVDQFYNDNNNAMLRMILE